MKIRPLVSLLVAVALVSTSCSALSKTAQAGEKLVDAIETTKSLPREFIYKETTEADEFAVKGVYEDDLRYSFVVARNDLGVFEAVVSDDTVAVRLLDPAVIPADLVVPPEVQALIDALRSGEWVVDPGGAPPLEFVLAADISGNDIGRNPTRDALTIFPYLRLAASEAAGTSEWNKNAVQPAYSGIEDAYFDEPRESLGVKRFDLVRAPLPRREGTDPQASEPQIHNFRKIAIFVKDRRIIKVKEEIEFENHIQFRRAREEGKPKFLLEMLERIRNKETDVDIRPRKLLVEFTYLPSAKVVIPAGLSGSLKIAVGFIFGEGAGAIPGEPVPGGEAPEQPEGGEASTPAPPG